METSPIHANTVTMSGNVPGTDQSFFGANDIDTADPLPRRPIKMELVEQEEQPPNQAYSKSQSYFPTGAADEQCLLEQTPIYHPAAIDCSHHLLLSTTTPTGTTTVSNNSNDDGFCVPQPLPQCLFMSNNNNNDYSGGHHHHHHHQQQEQQFAMPMGTTTTGQWWEQHQQQQHQDHGIDDGTGHAVFGHGFDHQPQQQQQQFELLAPSYSATASFFVDDDSGSGQNFFLPPTGCPSFFMAQQDNIGGQQQQNLYDSGFELMNHQNVPFDPSVDSQPFVPIWPWPSHHHQQFETSNVSMGQIDQQGAEPNNIAEQQQQKASASDEEKTGAEMSKSTALPPPTPMKRGPRKGSGRGRRGAENRGEKPAHTYVELIAMAIRAQQTERATLTEIYNFLADKFEFFRGNYTGWRNSIRHNLSMGDYFRKLPKNTYAKHGKGHHWTFGRNFKQLAEKLQNKSNNGRPLQAPTATEQTTATTCSSGSGTNTGKSARKSASKKKKKTDSAEAKAQEERSIGTSSTTTVIKNAGHGFAPEIPICSGTTTTSSAPTFAVDEGNHLTFSSSFSSSSTLLQYPQPTMMGPSAASLTTTNLIHWSPAAHVDEGTVNALQPVEGNEQRTFYNNNNSAFHSLIAANPTTAEYWQQQLQATIGLDKTIFCPPFSPYYCYYYCDPPAMTYQFSTNADINNYDFYCDENNLLIQKSPNSIGIVEGIFPQPPAAMVNNMVVTEESASISSSANAAASNFKEDINQTN